MASSSVLFEESRKRSAQDLLHLGINESGYIEGKIFMVWPSRNSVRRINIETTDDLGIHRFEVDIHSGFLENRDGLALRAHDYIRIALKGAKAEVRKESSAPYYFPVLLKYNDGVVIECLSGAHKGLLINTWEEGGGTSNWYDPGPVQRVSEAVVEDATVTVPSQSTLLQPHALPQSSLRNDSNTMHCKRDDHASMRGSTTLSKAQKRKRKRGARYRLASGAGVTREAVAGDAPLVACIESGTSNQNSHVPPPQIHTHNISEEIIRQTGGSVAMPVSSGDVGTLALDGVNAMDVDTALRLKAGIHTEMGDTFTALSDLRGGHAMINIIGVVTSDHGQKRTRTNEWSRSFSIVDPSVLDSGSVTVNCFQKKYIEWLPQVNRGDIVILRKLKTSEWNGKFTALGYGDKLRWAIYDPATHGTRSPNKGGAPDGEGSDDGFGYYYSPYWTPTVNGAELGYCARIAAWWKVSQERGATTATAQSVSSKVHRLLCDVSPNLDRGFFNCTVEILQKFENDSGPCTVYATDYTSNPHVQPIRATWCGNELQDYAFRFEMWDAAKNIARIMSPGEHWYFHNVRAKWNGNYMDGTMQEAEKVCQLDEGQFESFPHLKALLVRKNGLSEAANKSTARSNDSPSILLQDVDQRTVVFTCTVELLHVDLDSRDDPSIYVTDYTFRHDLPACLSTADWSRGLDHRVVRIKLDDSQRRKTEDLRPESFYKIVNLRLIQRGSTTSAYGRLGGEDKLIFPLHDLSSEDGQTLKRNKERWAREMMLDGIPTATTSATSAHRLHMPFSEPVTNAKSSTIQQILSSPNCPGTFTVVARAVDFFPFLLENACVLRCTKCKSDVPLLLRGCPMCDSMMETHCKWVYCLYLRLKDDEGKDIVLSLCGKECSFLQNAEPADFRYDAAAFERFLAKLTPVLGNLRDVHGAWSKNEGMDIESPRMRFTFESWDIPDGRGYGLLDYAPV